MKLSAHLGFQFNEVAFLQRFAEAAKAGYKGVEFPAPYAYAPEVLKEQLEHHGLKMVQFSAPMGDSKLGEKGIAAFANRSDEFKQGVDAAARTARYLDCTQIHVMAGLVSQGLNVDWSVYIANLRYATEVFAESGITTLIEVMSPRGMPDYYMSSFDLVERVLNEIAHPHLKVLVDTYHVAALNLDVVATLKKWLGRTGHIQIADYPGRNEPGTGTLPFKDLFNALDAFGYQQWVGCEYHPLGNTVDGLRHFAPYLVSSGQALS